MAAPQYMATGVVGYGTTAPTGLTLPGYAEGYLLFLFTECLDSETVSTPSGYTSLASVSDATDATKLQVFWKRSTASESVPTVSGTTDHIVARMMAVSGADLTTDWQDVTLASGTLTAGTSVTIPTLTTTSTNTLIVAAVGVTNDGNSTANFSSWTNANLSTLAERIDNTRNVGAGGGIGVMTGEKSTAGAVGNITMTDANSQRHNYIVFAIKGIVTPSVSESTAVTDSGTAAKIDINIKPRFGGGTPVDWDLVTIADSATVSLPLADLSASVSDSTQVTDTAVVEAPLRMSITQSVEVLEALSILEPLQEATSTLEIVNGTLIAGDWQWISTSYGYSLATEDDGLYVRGQSANGRLRCDSGANRFSLSPAATVLKVRLYAKAVVPYSVEQGWKGGLYIDGVSYDAPAWRYDKNGTGNWFRQYWDWTVNPATSQPWTPSEVNALYQWDFLLDSPYDSYLDIDHTHLEVSYVIGVSVSESSAVTDSTTVVPEEEEVVPPCEFFVSDSAAVTDELPAFYSETAWLSESLAMRIDLPVVASDATEVTDAATAFLPWLSMSVTDATQVTDSAQWTVQDAATLLVSVDETSDVTDVPTVVVPELLLSVTDSTQVTDTSTVSVPFLPASASDATQVTDTATVLLANLTLSVSDATQVTDTPTLFFPWLTITATDGTTVSDSAMWIIPEAGLIYINEPLENTTVTDTATVLLGNYNISVSDGSQVTDTATVAAPLRISASDGTGVTDTPTVRFALPVSASDGTTVTDSASVVLPELYLSVSDGTAVSDTVTARVEAGLYASEDTTVTDTAAIVIRVDGAVSDSTTVTDEATVLLPWLTVSVSEDTTATDNATVEAVIYGANLGEMTGSMHTLIRTGGSSRITIRVQGKTRFTRRMDGKQK